MSSKGQTLKYIFLPKLQKLFMPISLHSHNFQRSRIRVGLNIQALCNFFMNFPSFHQILEQLNIHFMQNLALIKSYYLLWFFDRKSCFVMFFLEWNEWKNSQFNFSCQNLSLERNFFIWDGKITKILQLLILLCID